MVEVEHVCGSQSQLGEGPIWHPLEQVLYWVDIAQGRLHRFDPASAEHTVTELGVVVGSMGLRKDGGFVMATKKGFGFWLPDEQRFQFLGDPDGENADARFNDGKTDRQGRFWAGKMSSKYDNSLFRLDPDCTIHRMESQVHTSNGLGWSPDNKTFYFTDSPALVIYAYDFDPASGDLANRRVFARIPEGPREGFPDGLAVDSEGCIWSARWGGWKVVRYDPQGQVERVVPMPVEFPTSCAFGGANLDQLYMTSAWIEVKADQRGEQPLAGDVFRLQTDVRGLPESFFAG